MGTRCAWLRAMQVWGGGGALVFEDVWVWVVTHALYIAESLLQLVLVLILPMLMIVCPDDRILLNVSTHVALQCTRTIHTC